MEIEINEAQFVQQPVSTSPKVEFKNNVEETSETHSQEINEAKFVQQPLSIPTTYSKDNEEKMDKEDEEQNISMKMMILKEV